MKANGRMFPLLGLLSALVVGALVLPACEEEDDQEPSPTPSPTVEVTTPTPTPTEVITPTPTPTELTCPETPNIIRPEPNQAVPMLTQVEVEAGDSDLYVLVRPIPDDPKQKYWVQARPTSAGNCRWISDPVYVGVATDRPGLPFALCAVVTEESLSRGQSLRELPQGPSHCIDVTRQ